MNFDVIIHKQTDDNYVARPVLWPDSAVHAATEQEAIERVHTLILDLFAHTRVVQVEVDIPTAQADNAWHSKAGLFADDPTWDDFLQTMADQRQELKN